MHRYKHFLPVYPPGTVSIYENNSSSNTPRIHWAVQARKQDNMDLYTVRISRVCMAYQRQVFLPKKLPKERLENDGYTDVKHTPGLFKHKMRPIWLTLTFNTFGGNMWANNTPNI